MKSRFILFKRAGIYYSEDTVTRKQHSLRTKDKAEAVVLLNSKNESFRQPVLNLQIARAYLTASDPALAQRTWLNVMEQIQTHGRESTRKRYARAMLSKTFESLRGKKLIETTTEDFLSVLKDGRVSVCHFLRRLHNLALSLGWLAVPVLAPALWPKIQSKSKRGITLAEYQRILAAEKNAERNLYYQLLWEIGAAQSDAAMMTAEDIDWHTRTLTYFRMKTDERAQLTVGKSLARILSQLPTTGPLFANISKSEDNARSAEFCRRCKATGIAGVSLHSYRCAWAERAKVVGMPERFGQAALGHNSKAVHRAYAKKAQIIVQSLEEYERNAAAQTATTTLQPVVAA